MTLTAFNQTGAAELWRVARRLYAIYAELDRTFELNTPPCLELEQGVDPPEPEALAGACEWFDRIDGQVQVWQLRQLLQSTNLQSEENLRYLIGRHMEKEQKTDADKEKIDFLLVQYLAHCAPQGVTEQHITLAAVAAVLEPALGERPQTFPDWTAQLDEKLKKMNACESLEELQDSGALTEAREMKTAAGDHYFQPALLVAFTRFNFLARRAFFRAMHVDLHAIRAAVNELEKMGIVSIDGREAGLSEFESLEHIRHVVHQWKTPFRAPYSGGSSFQQLILIRQSLERTLQKNRWGNRAAAATVTGGAASPATAVDAPTVVESPLSPPSPSAVLPEQGLPAPSAQAPEVHDQEADNDYLQRCVNDIAEQLAAIPPKSTPGVSTISLGGCKLMIATWEADAFRTLAEPGSAIRTLKRAVAARTILHVCMERQKRQEATDLGAALDIARGQVAEMKLQVEKAKEASNIDAAVNLAATSKRLLALVEEGERLRDRNSS
jgi:hypothetical protein